ncbi:MAG TPA: OmpA family protein [Candidatus Acidoferrum sp.]|jgi:OOP family OmpA-OmpF porin|nr:OmpA family protein [Candidatus Acidoferrum sp.]
MAETPPTRPATEPDVPPLEPDAQAYLELRQLILAPEQEALERLHQRVDDPASRTEDVGSVVAEAIQLRRKHGGDEALSVALAPTVETALRESVRKDPATLADALFPVMGPAIRRSILETLRSFLESFNQVLDQSLSVKGLKWRLEALRTGRTFTEVALLHSLVFRVEQVFLIHKKTGLPIGHAVASAVAMQDPSLVSGMLTAIQDFVRDSFHTSEGQGINRMNVGDLDVWIEQGPYAILACVIRGIAPRELRDRMAEVLENIHRESSTHLDHFDGDTAPFVKVNGELSRCLELRYRDETKPKSFGFVYATAAILFLLVAGWLGWRAVQYARWDRLVNTLREQPGIVITSFGREHGQFVVRGMRDPLAANPAQFITASAVNPADGEFHWGGYYALDDCIVQQRAKSILSPPATAILMVKSGVLQVSGAASASWVKDLQSRALLVPGIHSVELSPELNPGRLAFNQAKSQIESAVVKFPVASAALSPGETLALRNLVGNIQSLLQAADSLHQSVTLEVLGHTDSTGAEAVNLDLSQRRADRVAWELGQLDVPERILRARGVGTTNPLRTEDNEENRQFNRSATFRVGAPVP